MKIIIDEFGIEYPNFSKKCNVTKEQISVNAGNYLCLVHGSTNQTNIMISFFFFRIMEKL